MSQELAEQITVGPYVVALHDILGQGSRLSEWSDCRALSQKAEKPWNAMLQTVQEVYRIRKDFNDILSGLNKVEPGDMSEDEDVRKEFEEHPNGKEILRRLPRGSIHSQAFSDTNIWFTQAMNDEGLHLTNQIARLVLGVGFAHLLAMSRKVVCRGGIAIGAGTDALGHLAREGRSEIYGPVLHQAYLLENQQAVYPRVILSDALVDYIHSVEYELAGLDEISVEYALGLYSNLHVEQFKKFTRKDIDGAFVIDFAGEVAAETFKPVLASEGLDPKWVYTSAFEFIESEKERFASERNYKLSGRYEWIRRYLASCREFWQ